MKKKIMWLCEEDGEQFLIEANSLLEARQAASLWGAYVIRQLTDEEVKKFEKDGHL